MTWTMDGPQGFEAQKIKHLLPKYTRGKVLEIGCGMEKAFAHFVGYDNGHHFGLATAADVEGDAADLAAFKDEAFDAVFSSHVLEHMADMPAALAEWSRVIKPGGYLCLYVPSANLYPKCGEPGANPDHKHDLYPDTIITLLEEGPYEWEEIEREERSGGIEYSLFEVYRKLPCA
jgi:predicted SAM-dependent methyltransferase